MYIQDNHLNSQDNKKKIKLKKGGSIQNVL